MLSTIKLIRPCFLYFLQLGLISGFFLSQSVWVKNPVYWSRINIVRVIDGDTVEMQRYHRGKQKLRLAFIDAPELSQSAKDLSFAYGIWSANKLREFVSRCVDLKVASAQVDSFGRLVGELYCGKINVNLWLLQTGVAQIYRFVKFDERRKHLEYSNAQNFARANKLGIWEDAGILDPYLYRRASRLEEKKKIRQNIGFNARKGRNYEK